MPTFEVWTTGGGYYLQDIFNFLAMFTSGSAWMDFLTVGIIIGVFYTVIRIAVTGSMEGIFAYVVMMAVVAGLSVGPKARVMVMDSTYPLEIYGAVDNVPYSVAFVASLTSRTSYHLTRRMEALLSTPDNLVYQEHGMLFGASLMSQAARWRAVTPTIHEKMVNFMENCVIDATNIGHIDLNQLTREGDLYTYLAGSVPGSLAVYDPATGVQTCPDGWAGLAADIDNEVTAVLQARASARAPHTGPQAGVVDVNAITGTLEDFQNMMGLASMDASHYLRQSMMVLALDDAAGRLIANSGNSAAMQLYQTARAESQTRSSYQVIGANATKWVPLIKIVFETLYYGAFPLAVFMMMTPMAVAVARGYFGGFVWIAAWEPLSAILHTTMLKASTGYYREHTTTLSGTGTTDVLNWANHLGIQAVEQDIGTAAGYLMMSVPFLAGAIMFGATKMMGMATSMLNVSQGAAIDTGREAATGSIGLSNTSMNNMNANTWNTSSSFDAGRATQVLGDGGTMTRNVDGSVTFGSGSAQSSVGMSASIGQSVREEVSERSAESQRAVESASNDYVESLTATSSQLSDFGRSVTESNTAGVDTSWGMTNEERVSAAESWKEVEEFSERHGLSTDLGLRAMIAGTAGFGTPGGSPARLSASLEAQGSLDAKSSENFQQAVSAAQNSDYSSSISQLMSLADRASTSASSGETSTAGSSIRSNFDDLQQTSERLSRAYENAQSLERANAYLQGQDTSYNQTITDAVIGELRDRGYDNDQISALVNPKTTAGIVRQQEVVGEFLPGIIEELGISSRVGPAPEMPRTDFEAPSYTPVNPTAAAGAVATPSYGHLDARTANTNRLYDDNLGTLSPDPAARTNFDTTARDIGAEVDRSVGSALVERGVGMLPFVGSDGGYSMSVYEQDAATRMLLAEAGNDPVRQQELAQVIRDRLDSGQYGDDVAEAAFSLSPNTQIDTRTASSSAEYAQARDILQQTVGGADPNGSDSMTAAPSWFGDARGLRGDLGPMSAQDRDIAIRTILGEAADQGVGGQAAVAHVLRNRVADDRFGSSLSEVALAPQQFSAWNEGPGGNDLVNRYQPGDPLYERVGSIVDGVWSGQINDPTGGATHYYSPAGMNQLVADGHQSNVTPRWLQEENAARGEAPVQIGGHIFTGRVRS